MNYQEIINSQLSCEKLWYGTSFLEECIMNEVFSISESNAIIIKATRKSLVKIVNKIFPYIYLKLVETEIIEENINESYSNYYFIYDKDKLILLAKVNM